MDKTHFEESEKTWDKIANSFDKTRKKPWEICLNFIKSQDKNSVFADLGCGNGRHLIPAAKHFKKAIGVDISSNLLHIVENKIKKLNINNLELIHSTLTKIPLKDNSIDSILFIASLHNIKHRKNRLKALRETKRIIKKDGSAMISVWSREQDKFRELFNKNKIDKNQEFGDINIFWRQDKLDVPRFYHLYSEKEFKEDINNAGLKIVNFQPVKLVSKNYYDNYFATVKN